MALERQEWQKKRQTEAESWMKAKQAEIDAEKHRRYNEVRAQMEKGIETIMEESNLRLEEQREILRKEQAQHDQAMEDRRIEWMTVLKEESRKREATMKSRMEELESMHNLEIKRRQAEHEEEMKAIDRDAALQVTIREDAIKARIAELELAAQQVEREAIENENDRKRIWKERSERIEQEGKEKCRKEEDAWNIKRKSEQVRVDSELIQTNALLESELDNQRKAMAALKTACDTECQIMSNKLKKLESELISVKQENSKLIQSKPDMSDIEYRESLKQQDELLQRKYQTALDQMKAERDNALARIANHTCTKRDGEADNSLSDDEDEMEDVASSGLSDISDFSEADWNGYHSWNRQLNREQASITQAGRYLKQQRRSMSRARVALIKDQARWKKDSDASQDNPTGTDKHILVRELKRRKKFLDQRAHRLNSDISQYRRLKRGVSKRQDGLRDMIRESVNIPIKPGPDSNMDHQADKANTESKPSTTANTITNSVAKDTRAALNAHYGWLTSFRSEMQRSQEPGKAPGRYQLGRSPTNRTQPSLITPSNNNDITIRIKVEK
uniref:Uncharacterized protein n=1 Tax=Spongospora subterranea TaxID=70186 RepID=A0A0H5QP43_9EUKA|eukprot:CRZ03788.1 hypothetical protein [Spongospora subterranea]